MPVATHTSIMVCKEGRKRTPPHVHPLSGDSGNSLLELFYVRVDRVPAQYSQAAIYGTITMHGGCGTKVFWTRPQESPMPICPGECIPLEGPFDSPVPAADELDIEFDIYAVEHGTSGAGVSIAQDSVVSFPFGHGFVWGMETREIHGDAGSVTVQFMTFFRTLVAEITVILIPNDQGDNESDHSDQPDSLVQNVYGNITAHNGHGRSELFRKSKDQYVSLVPPMTTIPLCRDVVAVPRDRTLVVTAALLQHCTSRAATDTTLPQNDDEVLIARGDVEFDPERMTSQQRIISGEGNTKVVVRVSWPRN